MLKDATKTISIIWGVLSTLIFIALIVLATTLSANNEATIQELINQGMSEADAKAALASTAAIIFVFAFVTLASAVYSTVLATLVNNKRINRVIGIILGALAIILGALLPGILFIVDSVRHRDNNGAIAVESKEEKKEEAK